MLSRLGNILRRPVLLRRNQVFFSNNLGKQALSSHQKEKKKGKNEKLANEESDKAIKESDKFLSEQSDKSIGKQQKNLKDEEAQVSTNWSHSLINNTQLMFNRTINKNKVTLCLDAKGGEGIEFSISMSKSHGRFLVFNCSAFEGKFKINTFAALDCPAEELPRNSEVYKGPVFESLDAKVQAKALDLVQSIGVNGEFIKELEALAKEHGKKLAKTWTKDVTELIC